VSTPGGSHTPLGLVYDAGALIAAERDVRGLWAIHARALQRGVRPVVAAGCVVEVWRGTRQVSLARLLDGCEVEALTAEHAKRSGALRPGTPDAVGAIDATVVEAALRRHAAVVTSDRADVERLAAGARRRLHVIDV
jgi:hypothetical protein